MSSAVKLMSSGLDTGCIVGLTTAVGLGAGTAVALGAGTGAGTFDFEQIGSSSNGMTSAGIHEVVIFNEILSSANATLVRNDIANRTSISI